MWPYDFTGNENQLVSNSFTLFPNPFVDQLNIQLASFVNGDGYAEVFNTGGMLLRKNNIAIQNGQIQLEFSGNNSLSPGLYLLRITCNEQILLTEKIMKRP
jgi:hypothetical protein